MGTTSILPSISLYYKEGTSDKEYHVAIEGDVTDGYKVNFRYGKRGAKLTTGTKTKFPVSLEQAVEIMGGERLDGKGKQEFFGLAGEKMRKGYTTGEAGTPYINSANAGRVSGILPQLLNYVKDDAELEQLLTDDDWVMQEKKDGVRQMIKKVGKTIDGVNRKGLVVGLPSTVEQSVRAAVGVADCALDGEAVGEVFWLFDMLSIGVHAYSDKPYINRLEGMQEWLGEGWTDNFKMVPTAVGKSSKRALFKKLKAENAEGIVFTKLDSAYKAGRPTSGGNRLKFKFKATATVRVRSLNQQASFQMELLSKGNWTYVGDCTYYPTIYIPKPGQIVEVEYMYVKGEGGCLFQPIIKGEGPRTDVDEDACIVAQLKYQQGSIEGDDEPV